MLQARFATKINFEKIGQDNS